MGVLAVAANETPTPRTSVRAQPMPGVPHMCRSGRGRWTATWRNPDEGMEAVAPVSMVSTVASIEDLAVAVITPSLGREKNMILGIVALLHNYMASLPDCLANSLVPVSPLPTLEKQARSDSEKGSTSPSMPPHPRVVFEGGDVIAAEVPAANTGQLRTCPAPREC
jgi:hypothetical protein